MKERQSVARFVRDALASAVDKQKASANQRGRKTLKKFIMGESVLLSTTGTQEASVTNLGANKLSPRYIGPFKVVKVMGNAYTLDIPTAMRLHPTFTSGGSNATGRPSSRLIRRSHLGSITWPAVLRLPWRIRLTVPSQHRVVLPKSRV